MIWLGLLFLLGVAIAAAVLSGKEDAFQTAAESLGLKLTRSVPELLPKLDGMFNGLAVKVDITGTGEPAVRYRVFYPALGMALRLERENTISRTLGQLGSGDREIGEKTFDDTFKVNTSRPDALQKMMTPALQRQLMNLAGRYPGVVITDGDITYSGPSMTPTADEIVTTVNDLAAAAALLVAQRPEPLARPEPRPVAPSRPAPSPLPEQGAPPAEPQPDAIRTPPPPRTTVPAQLTPPPPPVPPPAVPPPQAPAPATGLPKDFFEDVFGANRLSFEENDTFDREIRGSEIRLDGTVKQARAYEGQSDVSPSHGTKAVVTVARIDTDLYGATDIDAVVYLAGNVALARGDKISFRGTIDGIDAFMRNLFVMDGQLTGPGR